ncbi:class I SAM-dependent methyltransferase [Microvirga flavescens]|uniref:class I SAM-dependent methyltransferase n=1 Tax=Microvirga flavescens TaxID=2249811 RepID=UPI000DDAB9AA|nr:class I SAM-dependent methyltransferase [Microvirga flavescens]
MADRDSRTLNFYAAEAEAYTSRERPAELAVLERFLALVPAGGAILELGCGGGQDSETMIAAGYDVTPTDGSPEIALQAEKRLGRPVAVLRFEDLNEDARYDGVFAHACLLHVPRAGLPGIIACIHKALKPGGIFFASFKAGTREGHDAFGRYFNYPSEDWLRSTYGAFEWQAFNIEAKVGGGYDGKPTDWLHVTAVKGQ